MLAFYAVQLDRRRVGCATNDKQDKREEATPWNEYKNLMSVLNHPLFLHFTILYSYITMNCYSSQSHINQVN